MNASHGGYENSVSYQKASTVASHPIPTTALNNNFRILEVTFDCGKCGSDGYDIYKVTPGKYSSFQDLVSASPGDIRCWDTSLVTDMSQAFNGNSVFNQPLHCWDVSNVEDMKYMFYAAYDFNQDIGDWDVSNVEAMNMMFVGALDFNQDIGDWDVSNVEDMKYMFYAAHEFNQCLSTWASKTGNVVTSSMFQGSGCPYPDDP
jgi:hypothetical protein